MNVNARGTGIAMLQSIPAIMLCSLLIFMLLPTAAGADPSEESTIWQEGDSWAIGFEEELDQDFNYQEFVTEILGDELDMEDSEFEDINIELTGIIGAYLISEVEETSPQYKIRSTASFGLHGSFVMTATGDFYEKGYHSDVTENEDGDWDIPKETRTVRTKVDFDIAVIAKGYEYRDVETLGITKQTYSIETAGKVALDGDGMPYEDEGYEDYDYDTGKSTWDYVEISYQDFSMKYSWDANVNLNNVYMPALESEPLSTHIGDEWNITYTVTTSGSYDGYVRASMDGDYPGYIEGSTTGSTRIDLTDPMMSEPPFVEGEIQTFTEEVTLHQKVIDKEFVILADGSSVECLVINQGEVYDEYYYDEISRGEYYYSTDHHRIVQISAEDIEDELDMELPFGNLALTPKSVSQAQEFNEKHADPSKIDGGNTALNVALIGGVIIIVTIIAMGIFGYLNKASGVDGHGKGRRSKSPVPRKPSGLIQQSPYQSGQANNGPMNQMPAGNVFCPLCKGAAMYYPVTNQYICTICQRPLPQGTAPPAMNSSTFAPPGYGNQYNPQTGIPPSAQQFGPYQEYHPGNIPMNQQPGQGSQQPGNMKGDWYCKICGEKIFFTPQYQQFYCMKCRAFR